MPKVSADRSFYICVRVWVEAHLMSALQLNQMPEPPAQTCQHQGDVPPACRHLISTTGLSNIIEETPFAWWGFKWLFPEEIIFLELLYPQYF